MSWVSTLLTDVKVGFGVAAGTVGTSLGALFDWLPDVGAAEVAPVIGMVLSSVLIYTHIKRHIREEKAAALDRRLKEKELERLDES